MTNGTTYDLDCSKTYTITENVTDATKWVVFRATDGCKIKITFTSNGLNRNGNRYDELYIKDGNTNPNQNGTNWYSSTSTGRVHASTGNQVAVQYYANDGNHNSSFQITVECSCPPENSTCIDFEEGFSFDGWAYGTLDGNSLSNDYYVPSIINGNDGRGLRIYAGPTAGSNHVYMLLPDITDFQPGGTITFNAWWESTYYGTLRVGYLEGNTIYWFETATPAAAYTGGNWSTGQFSVDIPNNLPEDTYLVFGWENNSYYRYVVIDNICITPPPCPNPSNVEVSDVTNSTATVSWSSSADNNYNVRYRKILFSEGFESGIPATWTTIDADNDGNNWLALNEISSTYPDYTTDLSTWAHGGANAASSPSYANGAGAFNSNHWLISPQLDLGGILNFYASSKYSDLDSYEVLLSTTGTATTDFTVTLKAMAVASYDSWDEVSIDLSAYSGQQGYIAIHHVSNDKYFLVIDDIGIYGDWTERTATTNSINLTGLDDGTTYEVQVQADCGNDGTSPWTSPETFITPVCNLDAEIQFGDPEP